MDSLSWQTTFFSLLLIFGALFLPGNAHRRVRRQLYLDAPDVLLPEPISDIPAPIVLPSGIVPDSGAVPSAGAIAPAPVIDPAPAILPANAIMEKNRATPVDKEKAKRFQLPFTSGSMSSPWNGGLSQELQFTQTQMPDGENTLSLSPNSMTSADTSFAGQNQFMSLSPMQPNNPNEMLDDATNRDQLGSNRLSFLQGQYNSPNQQSPEKVEYFEPNETESPETPPYLDSTYADTGPSKDDLKKIQPLLESESYITNAIIKDAWKQDNSLTSSRQAVSEGLTTAHQLVNTDLKNKPIVHEKPQQQANNNNNNNNNFLLDEARPVGMQKPESMLNPVVQEKRPHKDNKNKGEDNNNIFLDQAYPVGLHDHESPRKPVIKKKNNTSSFLKTDQLKISSRVNFTRVHDKSLASSSSNATSSVFQNNLIKKKVSESHSDSTNEWFTNATLAKSKNNSLKNNTGDSPKHDQLSKKLYTAADYLKSLYPQLSVFKAPLEEIKDNASLSSSTLSSLLHDKATLRKLISLAPRLNIKDVHGQRKNTVFGVNKISTEFQRKAQQELLKSLMKVNFMLGERSAIKQDQNTPGHTALSKLLLMGSKKPVKIEPVHEYLTQSGAKLLPAHIFSPLGSDFKDPLEHSSTPAAKTSLTTTPTTTEASQTTTSIPPILPSQAGQILSQTQSHAEKEPSTVAVIMPTQSMMIATAPSNSEKNQVETMIRPTVRDSKVSAISEAFIHPTMPTRLVSSKQSFVPIQSGFISDQTSSVKITLPTAASFLPTQIGYIPSGKQKDNIWTGPAENNLERNNKKPNTRKQRFFSHKTIRADKIQPKSGLSHFPRKPSTWSKSHRNSGPNLLNSRVADLLPTHFRERRQMFVPVPLTQTNNNPQEFAGQALLPSQIDGQLFLPNFPQLPQLQQPIQQFLPTQPLQEFVPQLVQSPQAMNPMPLLGQPDARSQFPFQQPINQIPQTLFSPQQNQDPGFPFGNAPGQLNQLSNSIGVTPIQHVLPKQNPQNMLGYHQNDVRSIGPASLSPITVNIPMTAPRTIPSFLTASQVYKDFEDVNSRSHLSDDIFGGQISRGDVSRNDFALEDDPELPEEPKYDKFAFENDKKMWGIDNDYSEDDGANIYREHRKHRKVHHFSDDMNDDSITQQGDSNEAQSLTNLRYSTGGRRFHRPRIHHRHHWVDENDLTRVDGKGVIGHNEGEKEELSDDEIHVADETTENASKEDSYEEPPKAHHSSKNQQPSLDDGTFETDQSEKSSSNDVRESDQSSESAKIGQSEPRESVETESETESHPQPDLSEDNSQGTQTEGTSLDDKSEKHDELKDGLEESTTEESTTVISSPKPGPSSVTQREEIIKKLSHSAVMHLNFDVVPHKPGDKSVQDESGNKNDAGLANGAEISNRTMGSCGRVAILKHGEVMYKAEHFTRKPTKAASIAMWVKSRKPGLVRWFEVGDNGAEDPATESRTKKSGGKLVKIPKNQWIHLAGTFDSRDGVARVYVNGKLISETVGKKNKGLPDDFTATGIGEKFGDKFISFLDDIFMFDRVITPAEVKILYRKCEFNRMVLHFGFQKVNTTTHQVMDQSGLDNNATIDSGAHIMNSGCDKCGACLDASNDKMPGVYLDGKTFHHKPVSAISIASWISLNQTKGRHSIFQAVSNKNDEWHDIYNVDVINGKLHWRHKNTYSDVIFDVKTEDVVIPEGLWSHVTATYSSESGDAKIYVNGLLKATVNNAHKPKLNAAWGRVSIGGHLPDAKNFAGLLDEFFIYNWALDPSEVRFVLKYCADKPKLVSFTVRVPLFKRQRVQTAPQALKYL